MWSTPTDAMELVASLKGTPGCYVEWETDLLHRLKSVFWSTADQQILARQFGGVVIQDNTCLTNRSVATRSRTCCLVTLDPPQLYWQERC